MRGFQIGRHDWKRAFRVARAIGLGISLVAAAATAAAAAPRIVTVGDVHGDLVAFKEVLREAGVLDPAGAWTGGETVLVQVGDLIDRGPSMRGALDFVMELEQAAAKRGGRVVTLLGNHEVMNLTGDLRYVVPANYAEFADAGSEKRRADAWRQVRDLGKRRAARLGRPEPPSGREARDAWLRAHPPGFLEHRAAFGPGGRYGRWLRGRPALLVEQGTAFLHGGLSPALSESPPEEVDRRVQEDLAAFDADVARFVAEGLILPFFDLQEIVQAVREDLTALTAAETAARAAAEQAGTAYTPPAADVDRRSAYERFLDWRNWTINSPDGPLWFRGFAQWSDAEGDFEMPGLLSGAGVERFVVGHTIQEDGRIRVRFGGAVFLIDTGLLASYAPGGRRSALEIADGTVSAIYVGEPRQVIWRAIRPAAAASRERVFLDAEGKPLPFADDEELLQFLREAKVVDVDGIGEGITRPRRLTLERNGVRARAIFRNVRTETRVAKLPGGQREFSFRDFYGFEPAAYRLGRLLGFDNIPPSALRRLDGKPGSAQIWIEKATTETRRREAASAPPDPLDWGRQTQMMLIWDALVGNTDRNLGNYLSTPNGQMWMIDHTRSFRRSADLRGTQLIARCERGAWERLRSVADAEIAASVKEDLRPPEISSLLERRRKLVGLIEGLIRERGEAAVLFDWPR